MNGATPKPRLVIFAGPTASGKSGAALAVARELGAELVGADSMQVYRLLDIGTAKPTAAERALVPHHLIDIVDVDEPYNAGRYLADGRAAVADILGRGKSCLVVGGTALYVKVLLDGLMQSVGRDEKVRAELEQAWTRGEREALWTELERADPKLAARLHPNDRTRIVRGLEVWRATGEPITRHQARHRFAEHPYEALLLGMEFERDALYDRIDRRTDRMLAAGWVDEVRAVLDRGYAPELSPLQAIGYREICEVLAGEADSEGLGARIAQATRQFAKRQMTWFRKMPVRWLDPYDRSAMIRHAKKFLQIK